MSNLSRLRTREQPNNMNLDDPPPVSFSSPACSSSSRSHYHSHSRDHTWSLPHIVCDNTMSGYGFRPRLCPLLQRRTSRLGQGWNSHMFKSRVNLGITPQSRCGDILSRWGYGDAKNGQRHVQQVLTSHSPRQGALPAPTRLQELLMLSERRQVK